MSSAHCPIAIDVRTVPKSTPTRPLVSAVRDERTASVSKRQTGRLLAHHCAEPAKLGEPIAYRQTELTTTPRLASCTFLLSLRDALFARSVYRGRTW